MSLDNIVTVLSVYREMKKYPVHVHKHFELCNLSISECILCKLVYDKVFNDLRVKINEE